MSDIKSPQYDALARELQYSARLYQWAELKTNPEFPPPSPGVYGWFFKCVPLPPKVPIDSCIVREGATLLYIGISPNNDKSTGDLRKRVRLHFNVTAEFSTLRLTLGCLLIDKLGTELLRDVSGGKTFGKKERVLSEWMAVNSMIAWVATPKPWFLEHHILKTVGRHLLLNIKGNPDNPFRAQLKDIRKKAVQRTRELDIVPRVSAPEPIEAPARVSAPEPIEAPAEQHFTIEDGATGHTYDTIFGRYLVGAKAITIEDPYIRTQHQVTNFVRFCEAVVRAGPTVRRINLITGYDDKTDRTMVRNKLEELKESLRECAVLLDIQWSETKHDREVQIDNGWTIKIGRGLDFYQRPNGWSSIGATDLGLRKCRETKVDIFRRR